MKNSAKIKKIVLINSLLVERFGIPLRNKNQPKPIDMLIATILSQNTNDKNSFVAYLNLRKKYPSWSEVEKESLDKIEETIRVAGLAKQKAFAIKNFLTELYKKQKSFSLNYLKEKTNFEIINELTSFPGIGVKTASCVLLFSMNRNICPVDTHVHRTLNRIGICQTKTPDKTFIKLNFNFPEGIAHTFHTNLIRLGREICLPQNPKCYICPLLKFCMYPHKTNQKISKIKEKSFMLLDNI